MTFLIVGAGSSAGRFIKILQAKGHQIHVYQHRDNLATPPGTTIVRTLKNLDYDGAIISCPTSLHLSYARLFVKKRLPTLIEKPISDNLKGVIALMNTAQQNHTFIMTGFNLRFLPIVKEINKYCCQEKIGNVLHADLYVGQYLPQWRPWLDYRTNYSSSHDLGGGVSLDLIHDIDLALQFFPNIKFHNLVSGKLGDLEIDTEDFVQFQTKKTPFIQVRMDYLNHIKTRAYRIVGTKGSIECDIINGKYEYRSKMGKQKIIADPKYFDVPSTFTKLIDHFIRAIKSGKGLVSERTLGIDALKVALTGRKYVPG